MSTFLVTGATGHQGKGVVNALLENKSNVRAYTRNTKSAAAQSLASSGVELFQGEFSDHSALSEALTGCHGVFINVSPVHDDFTRELEDGKAIIAAAKAAGVKHAIYSSVANLHKPDVSKYFKPGDFFYQYFKAKRTIEQSLRDAGFESYTIVRPGMFMANFIIPFANFMYPDLVTKGELVTSFPPDHQHALIDPDDIGKWVALAFADPKAYNGQELELAGDLVTTPQIVDKMAKASGKEVKLVSRRLEEEDPFMVTVMEKVQVVEGFTVDLEALKFGGQSMASFDDFLKKNHSTLMETLKYD